MSEHTVVSWKVYLAVFLALCVLTTATVMETSRGNFDVAIALGIILLLLAYVINLVLTQIQQRERPR